MESVLSGYWLGAIGQGESIHLALAVRHPEVREEDGLFHYEWHRRRTGSQCSKNTRFLMLHIMEGKTIRPCGLGSEVVVGADWSE